VGILFTAESAGSAEKTGKKEPQITQRNADYQRKLSAHFGVEGGEGGAGVGGA